MRFVYFGLIVFALAGFIIIQKKSVPSNINSQTEMQEITLKDKKLQAEVMRTSDQKAQGLIGHALLKENEGMLFVFDESFNQPSFWMKNMSFPIDIIWIAGEKVIAFNENALPDNGETLYPAPSPIEYVLEVYSGYVRDNNIEIGDLVDIGNLD